MNIENNDIVLKFSTDTGNTTKAITTLVKNLEKLKTALGGFNNEQVEKLNAIADAISKIGSAGGNIKGLTAELKKLSNVNLDNVTKKAESMKEGISKVLDVDAVKGKTGVLSTIGRAVGGFLSQIGEYSKIAVGGIKGLVNAGWERLQGRVRSVTGAFSNFFSSIGRIALYRLIRSGIKMVTQGFQEGIKNAYYWAKEVGNQFAKSMDMIKTSSLYLKNSLGAMVAPLINQIAPVIDAVIDRFVDLLNIINQVFALLGGQSTYFRALKYPAEYMEDTAGSTAKARKELELWLASFDELNIIPNQKDTGRGSGSANNLDYGSMFEEVDLTNPLKEAVENGEWEKLGRLLASKINGFIEAADFGSVGTEIGKRIGAVIDTAYGFLSELDFSAIGQQFGKLVTNAINNINWKNVGKLSVRKWTGLIDLVVGFLGKLDWNAVGKAFGDYIRGKLEELTTWIQKINWQEAGRTLIDKLVEFVNGLDLNTVINDLGEAIDTAAEGLLSFFGGIVTRIAEYVEYAIYEKHPTIAKLLGINGEELAKKFGDGVGNAVGYTKTHLDGVATVIQTKKPTLAKESEELAKSISQPLYVELPQAKKAVDSSLNDINTSLNTFSKNVDTIFGRKRTMVLGVEVGTVTVPKFTVETDNVSGVNFPVINARKYNIPMAYASGGFPEDGLFYANHGELVGKFNNGRTAVANNEQIIEGIKRGVMEGFAETGASGGDIYLKANLDGKVLFDAMCDRVVDYVRQTGVSPFPG